MKRTISMRGCKKAFEQYMKSTDAGSEFPYWAYYRVRHAMWLAFKNGWKKQQEN